MSTCVEGLQNIHEISTNWQLSSTPLSKLQFRPGTTLSGLPFLYLCMLAQLHLLHIFAQFLSRWGVFYTTSSIFSFSKTKQARQVGGRLLLCTGERTATLGSTGLLLHLLGSLYPLLHGTHFCMAPKEKTKKGRTKNNTVISCQVNNKVSKS